MKMQPQNPVTPKPLVAVIFQSLGAHVLSTASDAVLEAASRACSSLILWYAPAHLEFPGLRLFPGSAPRLAQQWFRCPPGAAWVSDSYLCATGPFQPAPNPPPVTCFFFRLLPSVIGLLQFCRLVLHVLKFRAQEPGRSGFPGGVYLFRRLSIAALPKRFSRFLFLLLSAMKPRPFSVVRFRKFFDSCCYGAIRCARARFSAAAGAMG